MCVCSPPMSCGHARAAAWKWWLYPRLKQQRPPRNSAVLLLSLAVFSTITSFDYVRSCRACKNPSSPTLTPTDGYTVYSTTAPKGAGMVKAWHSDLQVLMVLCDTDPACLGFSTLGVLKANVSNPVKTDGVDLFIKKTPAAGATSYPAEALEARERSGRSILPVKPSPTAAPLARGKHRKAF